MAFREQEPLGICNECETLTTTGCLRCGKPLCQEHVPPAHKRCDDCEVEGETGYWPFWLWFSSSVALIALLSVGVVLLVGISGVAAIAAGVVGLWASMWIPFRLTEAALHRRRQRFLAERKHPALPGASTAQLPSDRDEESA